MMNNRNQKLVNEICDAIDARRLTVSRTKDVINVKGNTISGKLTCASLPMSYEITPAPLPMSYEITPCDGFKWLSASQANQVYQSCIRYITSVEEAANSIDINKWQGEISLISDIADKATEWEMGE